MTRTVTVVLAGVDGLPLGSLPPFDAAAPSWIEMSDVVGEVRRRWGLTVDVLRLIDHERPAPPGGAVTYLAQLREPATVPTLAPPTPVVVAAAAADHPRRAPYARPGGPAVSLAWAREVLGVHEMRTLDAVQQRTWSVAAHWHVSAGSSEAWLKQVPRYQGAEPTILRWLTEHAPTLAPRTVAVGDDGRQLLAMVPGTHHYDGAVAELQAVAAAQHRLHLATAEAAGELVCRGVPDRRGSLMAGWIRGHLEAHVAAPYGGDLLAGRLARLPEAFERIEACDLPAVLAHGDNNPGNAMLDGDRVVLLDWGEGFVGHPAFDALDLVRAAPPADRAAVLLQWAARWRRDVPGSEPERAVTLLREVLDLHTAAVYAWLLANVEPAEHAYFGPEVRKHLGRALRR